MGILVASLFLLAADAAPPAEFVRVMPDDVVAQLKACGFSAVSMHYDGELQDDVLVIADAAATDGQLDCAARLYLESGYWVEVPETFRSRYFERYGLLSAESARQWGLRELEARGDLQRLPLYEAGTTDDAVFARKVETLCGDVAAGMLESEYGPHTISPEWIGDRGNPEQMAEALACAMRFSAAAGFSLGFIGNEKAPQPSRGE